MICSGADTMMKDKKSKAAVGCLLLVFVVVAPAAAIVTTIVATKLAAVAAAADAVADAIATTAIKRAQHYFPALVNWSVVENNLCPFLASLGGKTSTVAARARASAQSQMLATVSRRAPPAAQRKERRGKDIWGPCQASLSRGSGILFFIIHHDICKPLICIGADTMMNDKKIEGRGL